ncbi:hypothetical protein K227x_26280 [Rubripirellula lacrimiformis]|uniref:DUF2357 domain-containing protein n=1 Tax=Rubripirellula lacrimiformis TaxID=1930273 RepID=A0A517NB43_9BACT|nr:DUF2357 domain-containing protein [Rubripirellula lacrimiformis]QDT04238.1 hypothetical protein K227x_26280 [Rubripirellula lacrimiformis]
MKPSTTDNTEALYFLSRGPWPSSKGAHEESHGLRTFLWVDAEFEQVFSPSLGELVSVGEMIERDGSLWRRFELPKNYESSDGISIVRCIGPAGSRDLKILDRQRLPARSLLDEVEKLDSSGEDDEANDLLAASGFEDDARKGSKAIKLIDRHSDLVYQLLQTRQTTGPFTETDYRGLGFRSTKSVCEQWNQVGHSKVPPLSLIVRLADEIPDVLENVCRKPRVILRRQRELELATRIQQVDAACIRWMSRQPGRTLAEKAGPRQRLMAVVRREDCNTPENRVALDLLRRCKRAGEIYIARHNEFEASQRYLKVKTFVKLCDRLIRRSAISAVGKLVGTAQPNYVLQHEERYSVLWDAYQRLVRHEKVTQSTWMWRDRLWSEWLWFGIASSLSSFSFESPAHRTLLSLSDEPNCGRFSHLNSIGPWWVHFGGKVSTLHLLPQRQLRECSFVPESISRCCPDFVVACIGQECRGLAIWSNLDPLSPKSTATTTAKHLVNAMEHVGHVPGWKSLVVTGGGDRIESGELSCSVAWASTPLMLQDFRDDWNALLMERFRHVL